MSLRPRLRGRTSLSRSDPSAGVKDVVNMPLYTGRSGLCPSDLCLFNTDLSEVLTLPLSITNICSFVPQFLLMLTPAA